MRGPTWHARIECGGMVLGAGFLVTPSTVLTCAHVVRDGDAGITVSFPGRPKMLAVRFSSSVEKVNESSPLPAAIPRSFTSSSS